MLKKILLAATLAALSLVPSVDAFAVQQPLPVCLAAAKTYNYDQSMYNMWENTWSTDMAEGNTLGAVYAGGQAGYYYNQMSIEANILANC